MKNKESTRYASSTQENRIATKLGGRICPNSGAGKFFKSDIRIDDASLSIECKTSMTPKDSFSIKKDWISKHYEEAFSNRLFNTAIAFSFYFEDKKDYYIIDDRLMAFLVEKLKEENKLVLNF